MQISTLLNLVIALKQVFFFFKKDIGVILFFKLTIRINLKKVTRINKKKVKTLKKSCLETR